jgi:hypothetical protein
MPECFTTYLLPFHYTIWCLWDRSTVLYNIVLYCTVSSKVDEEATEAYTAEGTSIPIPPRGKGKLIFLSEDIEDKAAVIVVVVFL